VFLRSLADGGFSAVDLTAGDYARMADLVTTYGSLPLGTTDASVIALAERFRVTEVGTLDRRNFTVVRTVHVNALTLLLWRPAAARRKTARRRRSRVPLQRLADRAF
jgi:hypothetical protein